MNIIIGIIIELNDKYNIIQVTEHLKLINYLKCFNEVCISFNRLKYSDSY